MESAFNTRSTSFTVSGCLEGRGQRLTTGEDQARLALGLEPGAEFQDGVQFAAHVFSERLGRVLGQKRRQQDALHVVHHQQGRLFDQRAFDRQDRVFQVGEGGDGILRPHQLATQGIEHRPDMAVRLDRDERGAAHLLGAHQPAGELGGERGLAFAALAADDGVKVSPHPRPLSRGERGDKEGAAGRGVRGCGRRSRSPVPSVTRRGGPQAAS